jgi:hypothetical protein
MNWMYNFKVSYCYLLVRFHFQKIHNCLCEEVFLEKLKVHFLFTRACYLTLSWVNPAHILLPYFLDIHLNIILPSMPRPLSCWFLTIKVYYLKTCWTLTWGMTYIKIQELWSSHWFNDVTYIQTNPTVYWQLQTWFFIPSFYETQQFILFLTKNVYAFLMSSTCDTCPATLILLDLITLIACDVKYLLQGSSLLNLLYPPLTPSLLSQNILNTILKYPYDPNKICSISFHIKFNMTG